MPLLPGRPDLALDEVFGVGASDTDPALAHGEDNQKGVTFTPRLYQQRYNRVSDILKLFDHRQQLNKVVDLGCAEGSLLGKLRLRLKGVQHLVGVDIDPDVLAIATDRLRQPHDKQLYLDCRKQALDITLYKGSVSVCDDRLSDADAVVCVEVIEHLYEADLCQLPSVVFDHIRPRVAIFTTPNQEFNRLFQFEAGKTMRHWDHKFEWNRQQFTDWCMDICSKYPEYHVNIEGVGLAPDVEQRHLGGCSQMATFLATDKYMDKVLDVAYPFDFTGDRRAVLHRWAVKQMTEWIEAYTRSHDNNTTQIEPPTHTDDVPELIPIEGAYRICVNELFVRLPEKWKQLVEDEHEFGNLLTDADCGWCQFCYHLPCAGFGQGLTEQGDAQCLSVIFPAYMAPKASGLYQPSDRSPSDHGDSERSWGDTEGDGESESWVLNGHSISVPVPNSTDWNVTHVT